MYCHSAYPAVTEKQAALAQRRTLVGRGMAGYGELGKLRISFKHPFGKKSIFGKTVRTVGKVAKVAVPLVAGGLALKFGAPLVKKGITSLFRKKAAPSTTTVTPAGPVVTPAADVAAPSVAETIAQTAATLATSQLAPPELAIPGASAAAPAQTGGDYLADQQDQANVQQAGMVGGFDSKTLLIMAAVGTGALLLSKRR